MIPFTLNRHFREFLKLLKARKVKYLVVGGYAVAYHGFPRFTGDLDVFVAVEAGNAAKLQLVFTDFGFAGMKLTPADFLIENQIIEIGREPLKIQVLTGIDGVTFDRCYRERTHFVDQGLRVPVIGYEQLLKNKKATARGKDLIDVSELQKLRRQRKRG